MSEFLDGLRARSKDPIAVYHRFRTRVLEEGVAYVFVEGYEDKEFYAKAFHDQGRPAECLICFGKKNLDKILREFEKSPVVRVPVLFIRDSDFDKFLGCAPSAENLFLTCGYSVENYVCTTNPISRFLRERMGIDSTEVDIVEKVSQIESLLGEMNDWLRPLYARVFEAIERGMAFDLNALEIETYSKRAVKALSLPDIDAIPELHAMGLDQFVPTEGNIEKAAAYVAEGGYLGLRGKYALHLVAAFLKKLAEELLERHKAKQIVYFNRTVCSALNLEQVYSDLAARAQASARLNAWIRSVPAS